MLPAGIRRDLVNSQPDALGQLVRERTGNAMPQSSSAVPRVLQRLQDSRVQENARRTGGQKVVVSLCEAGFLCWIHTLLLLVL